MKTNMSSTDRVIRIVAAGALFILWFEDLSVKGLPGAILLAIAGGFSITSFIGYCPLYALLGVRTNGNRKQRHAPK
ncbi:MAG: DUF2892 domain-containing protein [Bacteroidetes bacterium]|nr:DUF2892 domain-containing protein [Bacteroidota bacterium]MBS1973375.1 DUF2892 domain-containing protein [Bacteroidota bacterium]